MFESDLPKQLIVLQVSWVHLNSDLSWLDIWWSNEKKIPQVDELKKDILQSKLFDVNETSLS